jgi:hypothetical protein
MDDTLDANDILDASNNGVLAVDTGGRIVFINPPHLFRIIPEFRFSHDIGCFHPIYRAISLKTRPQVMRPHPLKIL